MSCYVTFQRDRLLGHVCFRLLMCGIFVHTYAFTSYAYLAFHLVVGCELVEIGVRKSSIKSCASNGRNMCQAPYSMIGSHAVICFQYCVVYCRYSYTFAYITQG